MTVDLAGLGKAIGAFYDFWINFKDKKIRITIDSFSLARFEEDVILEVVGSNSTLRVDLCLDEIRVREEDGQ